MCGGPSQSEQSLAATSAAEAQQLSTDFSSQFANQQSFVQNFLTPQLQAMYTNPQGYGAQTIADQIAQLTNITASQAANARMASQQQYATNNSAGLPSGVQAVQQSLINSGAAGQLSSGVMAINDANNQAKFAQRMSAQQDLMQIPGLLGSAPQTGNLMLNANNQAFGQANTINQQQQQANWGMQLGAGLLGGAMNAGLGFATGGLSNMLNGMSFMGNPTGGGGLGGSSPWMGGGSPSILNAIP